MEKTDFTKTEYYRNRELSWLAFNERVLSEARDKNIPLFERLKFLSITASNLDEFFMIRVASLKDMVNAGYTKKDIAGLTAQEQLDQIGEEAHKLVSLQYSTYSRSLLPMLRQHGLNVIQEHEELTEDAFVLDVRNPSELASGRIPGSVNVPLDELRSNLYKIPKNRKIIVSCAVGLRGYLGVRILKQAGFDAYNLSGGFKAYTLLKKAGKIR